jgi:hypothetical protein
MKTRSFNWSTDFRSLIIVGNELYHNEYNIKCHITPVTADLSEQNIYFDRLKSLFELVFANTIISWRDETLFEILKDNSDNRFVELPKPPYDQVMAAVCFTKANAVLEGKILVTQLELRSYQGDGISYTVEKDGPEIELLDVDNWFSSKYNSFDPWWLRGDTATYDKELEKGIYTGHFSWNRQKVEEEIDKSEQKSAKIFEFNPKIIDGDKDKKK